MLLFRSEEHAREWWEGSRAAGAALTDHRGFGQWFRVKLDGPFVPGQVSRGQVTYPGYEHLKWEAVVQKMEPERLFSFTWHPYAVDPKKDYSDETPTLVEFRLERIPSGTRLLVTESGFDKRAHVSCCAYSASWICQKRLCRAAHIANSAERTAFA